ncbi:MAG: hypothetical protein M3Y81_20595 [Chloroflexota bacterium]|nr:hypothetical protein [Chloroflexota bacterium]
MDNVKMRASEFGVLAYILSWGITAFIWMDLVPLTSLLAYTDAFLGSVGLIFVFTIIGKKRQHARKKGVLLSWYKSPSFALGMILAGVEVMTLTPALRFVIFPLGMVQNHVTLLNDLVNSK